MSDDEDKANPDSEKPRRRPTSSELAFAALKASNAANLNRNVLRDIEIARSLGRDDNILKYFEEASRTADILKDLDLSAGKLKKMVESAKLDEELFAFGTTHKRDLESDISDLKKKIATQAGELNRLQEGAGEKEARISELQKDLDALRSKEQLRHLLDRVGQTAQESLLSSPHLLEQFERNKRCKAFVLSIDVRRSTDLMLKARDPELFAEFITTLAGQLRAEIIRRYGVFDKFTGDGVLAYFPEFFSGSDAGLLVADAAAACHEVFDRHYKKSRHCFMSVIKNAGLGIGIDYGAVTIVKMQGDLTIVGTPVVYACRLSGANAGETLVNQPAYETLIDGSSEYLDFKETSITFKHEGDMIAYRILRNGKPASPRDPDWLLEKSES